MSLAKNIGTSWAAAARYLAPAALLIASVFTTNAASAASLQGPVSGWQQGDEPGHISMYIYVPDNLAPNPPILVTLHYCGGTAGAVFSQSQGGGIVSLADQNGFILLIPQTGQNCWDVGTTPSLTNGAGGDTGAIVNQVEYTINEYGANPDRVYAIGTSGGGMAAQALLAVYPDVFKGGVEFSGVPAGCWAVNNMTDGQWSSPCANGDVVHTPEEWGDIVRNMYPGYNGFRPRVQLWHGTGDSTISFTNHTEAIKQWTNVMGLPEEPTTTSNVSVNGVNFTRDEWKDDCDNTVLDVMTEPNGPHNTSANMTGQYSLEFLSLDITGDDDPQAASDCGTPAEEMPVEEMPVEMPEEMTGEEMPEEMPVEDVPEGGGDAMGMGGAGPNPGMGGADSMGGTATTGGAATGGDPTGGGMAMVPPGGSGGTAVQTPVTPVTAGTGGMAATAGAGAGGMAGAATAGAAGLTVSDDTGGDDSGCAVSRGKSSSRIGSLLALLGLCVAMFARGGSKRSSRVS